MTYTEENFEDHIEKSLNKINYISHSNKDYNKSLCLLPNILLEFIQNSQSKAFQKLQTNYNSETEKNILERISSEIEKRGLIDVLRRGIKDRGVEINLLYFEPNSGLNPDTEELYKKNIFSLVRQLKYSPNNNKSIDVVLFINGIPILTIELKNSLTGQRSADAIKQYINDRDPAEKLLNFQRCIAHFAVGNEEIYLSTKLQKSKTFFLPFNKDIINPINSKGHKTAYLWEEVFLKENLLDLIRNYIHVQKNQNIYTNKINETLVFPRYHQFEVINKLNKDLLNNGIGKKYLIQHATGSGKSLSIAWLAYNLRSLFLNKSSTNKLFDTVIILTDRRVLDKNIKDTFSQLKQDIGVVNPVEKDSQQLKNFIEENRPIIISTIQKFPFISSEINNKIDKKYAVIIDEVHSSQSGRLSTHLIKTLSNESLEDLSEGEEIDDLTDIDEFILKELEKNLNTNHISYFGFSGTPKQRTLEIFGTRNSIGEFKAFHEYTMQQSIAENFTLDVLKNFITYERFFNITKKIEDDKIFTKSKLRSKIIKYVDSHPKTIKQKVSIIIEYFLTKTSKKIQNKAKAMVVVKSRAHCVKYKREFDNQMKILGLPYKCLVGFSGVVKDPDSKEEFTESSMNGFPSSQIESMFHSDDFRILIANNKFQTGFNEPLLHTMFVDKKMLDLQIVQTLSRLNRTHVGKVDTSVIDFVNKADVVKEAFQKYYKGIILSESTNPNDLYDMQRKIESYNLFNNEDVNNFCKIYLSESDDKELLQPILDKIADNVSVLEDEIINEFRQNLIIFIRSYDFINQLISFADVSLEKLYIFCQHLLKKIPHIKSNEIIDIDSYVDLEYLKIDRKHSLPIVLEDEDTILKPKKPGSPKVLEDEKTSLSQIIQILNEAYGAEFNDEDKIKFNLLENQIKTNEKWKNATIDENTESNKRLIFKKVFDDELLNFVDDNLLFYEKVNSDKIKNQIQESIYTKLSKSP
tara:strand:- start:376 stop:3297 length:2922 start_codon:yes stop_codon:yes gene_type:complete